jgi:hypothetical protein
LIVLGVENNIAKTSGRRKGGVDEGKKPRMR